MSSTLRGLNVVCFSCSLSAIMTSSSLPGEYKPFVQARRSSKDLASSYSGTDNSSVSTMSSPPNRGLIWIKAHSNTKRQPKLKDKALCAAGTRSRVPDAAQRISGALAKFLGESLYRAINPAPLFSACQDCGPKLAFAPAYRLKFKSA